jgi:NAD(P)-dependent dehydrogenase (short-subunit alcohol dehydrogenase family)
MTSPTDPFAAFRLDDRVAIVTGASSGIGVRLAEVLAAAGASVVLAARRLDRLEKVAAELPGSGHLAVPCDMANDDDLEALVQATIDRHGQIDILVNNAGISDPQPAETEPIATFRLLMEVNLIGAFALTQRAARHMLSQGRGAIVNVGSVLGSVASGQIPQASYTASKGGLVNLTRELAVQWARRGVRVNALCPGWFETEMTQEMFDDESGLRWIRRNTPMGRPGELKELDGALLFLASDASSYVTGAVLLVDGGWTAR